MSNFKTTTTMGDTITLNKLSIGFNSICEQTEPNAFTITGDITLRATDEYSKFNISVDKLKVVYNNEGLLEHINKSEHKSLDVFSDAERYFVEQELVSVSYTQDYKLATDGNSIEMYADFDVYGEDMY